MLAIFSSIFITRLRRDYTSRLSDRLSPVLQGSSSLKGSRFLIHFPCLNALKLFTSFNLGLHLRMLLLPSSYLQIIAMTELGSLSLHQSANATNYPSDLLPIPLIHTPLSSCMTVLSS